MDIGALFRESDPLSPRYVLALVRNLPPESACAAARRGGQQFRGWTPSVYAQVATVNALRGLQHMYMLTHIDSKKSKPKPPEPFPIPDQEKTGAKRPGLFAATANNMLAHARKRKASK